ncbi:unnamed protein product [Trichogramma brassicae]|uniref:C2H2-type domain-containing protein n=1 Tax=Trichogramma brassicae TaxID=86971 RepID=A0A6H5HX74_9HYME|nr:unnamed protein product [Trichogramma brassicae]
MELRSFSCGYIYLHGQRVNVGGSSLVVSPARLFIYIRLLYKSYIRRDGRARRIICVIAHTCKGAVAYSLYAIHLFHEGRKDHACDICEKKFGQKSSLISHQRTVHEGQKDFACDKCDKKFGHKSHLIKHQKTVHEGRKDYACGECEKKFGHKRILLLHKKTVHEGRKDYRCDKCEKKFGHKSHLIKHQKTVHEGRKDYICDKCEKAFGHKQIAMKVVQWRSDTYVVSPKMGREQFCYFTTSSAHHMCVRVCACLISIGATQPRKDIAKIDDCSALRALLRTSYRHARSTIYKQHIHFI